jgi:putative ABC transport system permease protein
MQTVWRDIRFGLRMLAKTPGFTALAVLTLALGIGANTAIFSVVYAALLEPLPYPKPEQLVMVWARTANGHNNTVSAGDFLDWKRQTTAFRDLAAWTGGTFSLSVGGHPEALQARITTPNFFAMQGIAVALGRDFLPEEGTVGKEHVAILTNRLWRERFGSDPQIVGKPLRLDGEPYTVVGVLAAGMPDRFESPLFLPLALKPEQINHDYHFLLVMGRLKDGVTLQQANTDLDGVARRIAEVYPASNKGWGARVQRLQNAFTSRDTIKDLWLLLSAVGFVLLIACVNVANLLLARAMGRRREVAIRTSLGAPRWRIYSQFLMETMALALIGGIAGAALAASMLKAILALLPQYSIPTEADVRLSLPVLFFTLGATLLAAVLCGCAPAWQTANWGVPTALKESGHSAAGLGRQILRRALVVAEFALALTLLAGAGLVIHSFWKLTQVDLGFRRDHVLTFSLPVRAQRFANPEQMVSFYRDLLAKIQVLPGISSVAASTGMPLRGTYFGMPFQVVGQAPVDRASRPSAGFTMVTPEYFQTFGIEIEKGRGFTEQDQASSVPVAIVNESFVKHYFPNADPLTQRVVVDRIVPGATQLGPPIEWQIVGVYRDVHNSSEMRSEEFPEINVPFWQSPVPAPSIAVRTGGDPASMTTSIAAVIQSVDSDLPMDQVRTMDQIVDTALQGDRFATVLFAIFAAIALLLAAIGIYSVMSFVVSQRTQEIGLRMALGASTTRVLLLFLREGMRQALLGLGLGLLGTFAVGQVLKSVLFGVTVLDPVALGAVAVILLLSALLACYVPARRATRVDPMVALRYE